MTNIHISLTDELANVVQAKVASGLYSDASEVIRDAIRQMDAQNAIIYQYKLQQLKQALQPGIEDAIAGRFAEFSFNALKHDLHTNHAS